MKTLAMFAALATIVSVPGQAQKLNLNFDAFAKNATEKTELNLEGPMLDMLKQTLLKGAGKDPNAYASVTEIGVHSYEYAKAGDYSGAAVAALRDQVTAAGGWSTLLSTKDKDDDTAIYVFMQGDKPAGFLLINAEPKEVNVIHVAGSIELARLQELVNSSIHFKEPAQE
ncbi:MAG TPA: DUF4252 domain-containing protein [Bryobacteraceae bacterium]|jgi:hypothetical protein